jgi:hypothetical protein
MDDTVQTTLHRSRENKSTRITATCKLKPSEYQPHSGWYREGRHQGIGSQVMKSELTNMFKASLALVAGWIFAGWLLFLLIAWASLISQA